MKEFTNWLRTDKSEG